MTGFEDEDDAPTPAVMDGVATEREERPDGGPKTERVEVEPVATFPVYYAWHRDDKVRPFLIVADGGPTEHQWDELFGPEVEYRVIGFAPTPMNSCLLCLDYEAAAWEAFGDYEGSWGRPCHVQCVDLSLNERLVAEVAACVWAWPEHAPPGAAGPATVEAVAAAIRRHPADVRGVFERFKVSEAMALWAMTEA